MSIKKIVFYSLQGIAPLHLGQGLEILQEYLNKGTQVKVVTCDNALNTCFFNPCHNVVACSMCESRSQYMHQKIGINKEDITSLKKLFDEDLSYRFDDLDQLLSFEYKGMDVGRGVASSFISLLRNYNIDGQIEQHQLLINELLKVAINVVENFIQIVKEEQPDRIVLFNGRFAELYPVICIAKKHGIDYETYETGSSQNKYQIFRNSLPHSIKYRHGLMMELWRENKDDAKESIGEAWFLNRRKGIEIIGKSFIKNQVQHSLPQSFDDKKMNIAIFNSSEDEVKVIEEFQTPLFNHQNEIIEKIIREFYSYDNVHFYLRCHPNLSGVNNIQMQEIKSWNYPNLTVILPENPIDSYHLMESCDKVLTFGSSMGIEATFYGQPSILYGNTFYMNLDVTYNPKSFKELTETLLQENLKPKSKSNTIPYGYFLSSFGQENKSLTYNNARDVTFNDIRVKRTYTSTFTYLAKYLKAIPLWKKMNRLVLGRSIRLDEIFKLKSHIDKKKMDPHN